MLLWARRRTKDREQGVSLCIHAGTAGEKHTLFYDWEERWRINPLSWMGRSASTESWGTWRWGCTSRDKHTRSTWPITSLLSSSQLQSAISDAFIHKRRNMNRKGNSHIKGNCQKRAKNSSIWVFFCFFWPSVWTFSLLTDFHMCYSNLQPGVST